MPRIYEYKYYFTVNELKFYNLLLNRKELDYGSVTVQNVHYK